MLTYAQMPLGSSRLVMTRLDTFDLSSQCILAVSSLSNSTARHTRHVELDCGTTRLTHKRNSQLRLSCNLYKVMICKSFINLLEYTFIKFILFDGTNRICKDIKTTKLVQASTIACSSSAMLEQHDSIRSSRLARHVDRTCRVVLRRDEQSGIWVM